MNAQDIEIAVANYFNPRRCLIVPNISWGLLRHGMEVDVMVIQPSRWAAEIEIKTSASDIRADKKKRRHVMAEHYPEYNELFRQKYFAVPEALKADPNIPLTCGVFSVGESDSGYISARLIRPAKINKHARPLTESEISTTLRLASMRVWTLKRALQKHRLNSQSQPPDGAGK